MIPIASGEGRLGGSMAGNSVFNFTEFLAVLFVGFRHGSDCSEGLRGATDLNLFECSRGWGSVLIHSRLFGIGVLKDF